jgi:hypothetical protein
MRYLRYWSLGEGNVFRHLSNSVGYSCGHDLVRRCTIGSMRNWRCGFGYLSCLGNRSSIGSSLRSFRDVDLRDWYGRHCVCLFRYCGCSEGKKCAFLISDGVSKLLQLLLSDFRSCAGVQRGKATSQNEAEKQDFWDGTECWLVHNNDRPLTSHTTLARSTYTPEGYDADGSTIWWCGVKTLFR